MNDLGTPILVAFVGLLSAILGGVIQALFARNFEKLRFEREARWELYSQYFMVLGELTFADQGSERQKNALSLMAQLRGRIGILGSPGVIKTVSEVFLFPDLRSTEAQVAMAKALDAMRRDVGNRRGVVDHDSFVRLMFSSRETE